MGNQRAVLLTIAALAAVGIRPVAATRIGGHVEGGFGPTVARPLEVESASGLTGGVGLSVSFTGPIRPALELTATAGGDFGMRVPEASRPGDRTLATILLGAEWAHRTRGPFAFLGAGIGHATLKNATGVFEAPFDRWLVPTRDLTAFAFGAGIGYRTDGGPGPFGFQFGLRTHALVDGGWTPASAYALTVGIAY